MPQPEQIAIAGGGIVGLSCALALRRRGLAVSLFEAATLAREASWAAGGMLAVDDPGNPPALLPLSRYSRGLFEEFLRHIQDLTGERVPFRTRETVQIMRHDESTSAGVAISPQEARALIPGLRDSDLRYRLVEEASLDPRELCRVLIAGARAAGVVLTENARIASVSQDGDGVLVRAAHLAVRADRFVNCCGAWAASLSGFAGISPSKGQMLVVAQPPGTPPLTRVLRSPQVYLIPRGDGRIVIGATVENAGYSKSVESRALALLRRRAAALWPPAMHAVEVESWAGLRPATGDDLPRIGTIEDCPRQILAAGHFRNGILLAPGTAEIVADLICGAPPAIDLAPFAPCRASMSSFTSAACDKHFAAAL